MCSHISKLHICFPDANIILYNSLTKYIQKILMRLTKDTFHKAVPLFYHTMKRANYFAVDFEFTGITKGIQYFNSRVDTLEDRYWKQKAGMDPFFPLQIGITGVEVKDGQAILYPFNVPLWPYASKSLKHHPEYGKFNALSFGFLSHNYFDFNDAMYEGVPYISYHSYKKMDAAKMDRKLAKILKKLKKEKSGFNPRHRMFSDVQFPVINHWLKLTKDLPLDDPKNEFKIDIVGVENEQWNFLIKSLKDMFPEYNLLAQHKYDSATGRSLIVIRRVKEKIGEEKSDASERLCMSSDEIQDYLNALMQSKWEEDKKVSEDEIFKLARMVHDDTAVPLVPDLLGSTRLIRYIASLNKPLVVHNGFLDLLLTHKEFIRPLPNSSSKYKKSLSEWLPTIYDTKYMATSFSSFFSQYPNSQLSELYSKILPRILSSKEVIVHPAFSDYSLESKSYHEAGYDSMMTGAIFAIFQKDIEKNFPKLLRDKLFSQEFRNKLAVSGFNVPFNLEHKEKLLEERESVYVVAGLPQVMTNEVATEALEKAFKANIRLYRLFKQDIAYFTFTNPRATAELQNKMKSGMEVKVNLPNGNEPITVATYEKYMDYLKEEEDLIEINNKNTILQLTQPFSSDQLNEQFYIRDRNTLKYIIEMERQEKERPFLYEFADVYALYIQPLDIFNVCLHHFILKQRFPHLMATCSTHNPPAVYYTGGQSESKPYRAFVEIKLDFSEGTCIETYKESMVHTHYAHGMLFTIPDQLIVISGFNHEHKPTKHCEKYVLSQNKWQEIAPLQYPRGFFATCVFEQQFIYVFGGCLDPTHREVTGKIECYRTLVNRWEEVKLLLNHGWKPRVGAMACQIDEDAVLVFGGIEKEGEETAVALEYVPNSSAMKKVAVVESVKCLQGGLGCVQSYGGYVYAVSEHKCFIYDTETHWWKKKVFDMQQYFCYAQQHNYKCVQLYRLANTYYLLSIIYTLWEVVDEYNKILQKRQWSRMEVKLLLRMVWMQLPSKPYLQGFVENAQIERIRAAKVKKHPREKQEAYAAHKGCGGRQSRKGRRQANSRSQKQYTRETQRKDTSAKRKSKVTTCEASWVYGRFHAS
eukprot:TRINITY_DN68_c0_g1_i1.p1 TRINITY_DN68_c0_g1~~TRINITY_DN68_c0_g1_i1.p1  ORF type:complete len:1090 (-),score=67.69 TRINITY_DN68_c0_g1_i1:3620-6889(-)